MNKRLFNRKTISKVAKAILILHVPYLIYTGCINIQSGEVDITLSVESSSLSFTYSGERKDIYITTNDSWTVSKDASWLSISSSSGANNGTISVTAEANTSFSQRTATITVRSTVQGVREKTINITQGAIFTEDQMVYVQGGTFTMGCTSEQGGDCYSDQLPIHRVTLSDFYIGKYEVTQGLWKAVMNNNPSYFTGSDNYPVEMVRWNDIVGTSGSYQEIKGIRYYANGFIYKLNQLNGKQYRLPTEAEWEFAARGGNSSKSYKYSGSNTVGNVAWYLDNSNERTHIVGGKSQNELGIYDMSGNVWEWCGDWYGTYSSNAQTNPSGPSSGDGRVARGCCWGSSAVYARVSYRLGWIPSSRNYNLGFRLARSSN